IWYPYWPDKTGQLLNRSCTRPPAGKSRSNYLAITLVEENEQHSNPDGVCLVPLSLASPVDSPALFTVVADRLQSPRGLAFGPGGGLYVIACECSSFPSTQNSLRKS